MCIKYFTIYGERCSGTNYLHKLILTNFDIEFTSRFGHKHFFGFQNEELKDSDDTLFICIVRDPIKWANSFYREKHHSFLRNKYVNAINKLKDKFFNEECWSINSDKTEMMEDRHIYTGKRYKTLFEMRYTKLDFLLNDLPHKVKNYIFIRYEDLLTNFNNTMDKFKTVGLIIKPQIIFPINTDTYKDTKNIFIIKEDKISAEYIYNNVCFNKEYETKLGY
jgi:hypothetical protein